MPPWQRSLIAIATALHAALSHHEIPGSYVRILFIDFSSAFNTIISGNLVRKLCNLNTSTCTRIKDFLTNRPQTVKIVPFCSSNCALSTRSPQGSLLSPLPFTLYTHNCTHTHPSDTIIKFADDTTIVGLIDVGDESAYRDEILNLAGWSSEPAPLYIRGVGVEMLISEDPSRSANT